MSQKPRIRQWIQRLFSRSSGRETPATESKEPEYPRVLIPERLCEEICQNLMSHSPSTPGVWHEGVAYLAGIPLEAQNSILFTSSIIPEAKTAPRSYRVSTAANAKVTGAVHEHNIQVLSLIHSHPGARTGHSPTDDEEAMLPFEGYLSIVVPNYARDGMRPLTKCGIHRYEDNAFRRLTDKEIENTFTVVPNAPLSVDTR